MNQQTHRQALPKGFMLQEYQVDRVLGAGGFGLTYLGWDTALEKPVAVKEYLPNDLAVRETNHSVAAKSRDDEDNFRWGLTRFLDEARTLARFKHPNIVSVYRYFEAHGTAYIVMEFVEGETFGAYLKRAGKPKESFLRAVLAALLDGLAEVHRAGFMHRDIKPGNILLNAKGVPVLVDFGSARQEIGGRSRSITSVVTPGYAPIEQYSSRGNQGPWTDIYALGAVAYRAITGAPPPDATERVLDDAITPAVEAARDKYSAEFLRAIDSALAVNNKDRLQDVDAWREALREDGKREERWGDGTVATGRYVNDKRQGHWVLRTADGGVQEGPYVDGKKRGPWVLRWADGQVEEGLLVNGKKHGHWVERFANGDEREIPYKDGKPHGLGFYRWANGRVKRECWENGKEVDC
ncbi:MAG: protein kinase [Gammaproteobacteria bacterium]|nr:protein kinase [Gammaproteobacteria bacterium]